MDVQVIHAQTQARTQNQALTGLLKARKRRFPTTSSLFSLSLYIYMYICICTYIYIYYILYIIYACKCVYKCIYKYNMCIYIYCTYEIICTRQSPSAPCLDNIVTRRPPSAPRVYIRVSSVSNVCIHIICDSMTSYIYISYIWLYNYIILYIYIHDVNFILLTFQGSGAGRQPLMSWRRCNKLMPRKAVGFRK